MIKNNTEIERKFLVDGELFFKENFEFHPESIQQGYLSDDEDKIVRVRTKSQKGFITIKGNGLLTRSEYEYEIPLSDAIELLDKYCKNKIIKKRYRFTSTKCLLFWEIDVFEKDNEGLILAEIELTSEDEKYKKPDWIKEEVTDDPRYQNSNLAKNPFKNWNNSTQINHG